MKLTFAQVSAVSLVGLIAILALLYEVVSAVSRETIDESSERIRNVRTEEIGQRVKRFLGEAPAVVEQFRAEIAHGLADPDHPETLEPTLFALLLANDHLAEVTFTYGRESGFDADGNIQVAPEPRGQWSAMRVARGNDAPQLWSRHVGQENGGFVADRRDWSGKADFASAPMTRESGAAFPDPTTHPTFTTPARQDFRGQLLWSDLHWSQLDEALPPEQRRVEVSVQEAVLDASGQFAGVLRVGLSTEALDEQMRFAPLLREGEKDPHRTFLCDPEGRLITRLSPEDRSQELEDALRIGTEHLSPEIKAALASPELKAAAAKRGQGATSGTFVVDGVAYKVTFRALPPPETQDWLIGIVVPRAHYFGQLAVMRQRLLAMLLGIMILLVGAGGWILWAVRRGQAQITRESLRMNAFDFSPARPDSLFRDVADVLESQEKAKSAMRAMSKYVPIDLVRRLYREKREPVLGGELMEVTLMFTDIKDFTTVSEKLAANDLADASGRYLAVMARIIQQESRGTIDKFIGDAIMTFWNAPEPVPDHARLACLAALRCREAARALAQSPEWGTRPVFETRFGLHRAPALIGHFGAPDRMNYTAMGDAVNLASRLEGLNKQYGTTIIASETIVQATGEDFVFRLLDRVAVKGKTEAIRIYEVLGRKGEAAEMREVIAGYDKALAAYSAGDFAGAIEILEPQRGDGPSAVLLKRCRAYLREAPAADWDGVYVAVEK